MPPPVPFAASAIEDRIRWQQLARNAAGNLGSRVITGLAQLVLVPLLLSRLGTASFGWCMSVLALSSFSHFGDMGIAIALQHALAEAWAARASDRLRALHRGGLKLLSWLGLGWFVLLAPALFFLGPRWLPAPQTNGPLPAAWLMIAAAIGLGIPAAAGVRLAAAVQLAWITSWWTAGASVAALATLWLLPPTHDSAAVVGVVGILSLAQVVPGWITMFHVGRRLGWSGRTPQAKTDETRSLWRSGLHFAAPNVAGALLQMVTPGLIARFGSYAMASAFAVMQRTLGLIVQAHALALAPFWPAYTEAVRRGSRRWLAHSFRLSLVVTVGASVCIAAGTMALPWLLERWLRHHSTIPDAVLAWAVAGWMIATMVAQALSFFLLGVGRAEQIAHAIAVCHVLTLAALVVAGALFGGTGVAVALAVGTAVLFVPLLVRATMAAWQAQTHASSS